MAVKIRLQRHGKKDAAFFHVVVADGRAPRDGAFIEKLGTYNPNTNPATININFDKAVKWVMTGAQPSDTCKAILSYKGVMMKKHLLGGVAKGALTAVQAEAKFAKCLGEKEGKVTAKKDRLSTEGSATKASKLKAETKVKEAKAEKIAAKATPAAEIVENTEAPAADTTTEENA